MLSDAQLDAARTTERIAAVFAGAGSGKTTVVAERIEYLARDCGVPTSSILVITFTKKAADEIGRRVKALGFTVRTGTFHSVLLDFIKSHSGSVGMPYGVRSVLNELELRQCELLYGKKFDAQMSVSCMAVSFDSILELGLQALRDCPELLIGAGGHVIVDESQDNSSVQWDVVESLAACEDLGSLMVVGDFRQSIYEWRAATPERGIAFCDRPDAKRYYLSENYRSGSNIVDHANRIIDCGGFSEPMEAMVPETGKVTFVETPYVAAAIASKIDELANNMVPLEEVAVICRYNADADAIAQYLREEGIPVDRTTTPGRDQMERLCAWANMQSDPFNPLSWSAAASAVLKIQDRKAIVNKCTKTKSEYSTEAIIYAKETGDDDLINRVTDVCDLVSASNCLFPAFERVASLFDFSEPMVEWLRLKYGSERIDKVSEAIAINIGSDDRRKEGVFVTTGHSCKGLEFDHVFIAHPSQAKSPGSKRGRRKEEERRLMYVLSTRPRETLTYVMTQGEKWSEFVTDDHGRFLV